MRRLSASVMLIACVLLGCNDDPGSDAAEGSVAGDCTDGLDNDGDGAIDCDDPGCAASCGRDGGPFDAAIDTGTGEDGGLDASRDGGGDAGMDATIPPVCERSGSNNPPVVFWPRPVRAHPGIPMQYSLVAYDPDRDAMLYSLEGAPEGMTIDALGVIRFEPMTEGSFEVTAIIDDRRGGRVEHPFTLQVQSADFLFVAPDGSDAASGTIDAPYATIEHGMSELAGRGSGTLIIRGGDYDTAWNWERDGVSSPMRGLDFSADEPAEIRGYPGESVRILADGGHGLWAFQNSYVLFADIEVVGATAGERGGAIAHGDHIVFHNITVRDSDWSNRNNCTGFLLTGHGTIAHRCQAHDNYDRGGESPSHNSSNYLVYADSGDSDTQVYIVDSLSTGSTGPGFKIKHAGEARLMVHGVTDIGSAAGFGGADDGSVIRYSTFVDNGTGINLAVSDPNAFTRGEMRVEYNTVAQFSRNGLQMHEGYLADGDVRVVGNVFHTEADLTGTSDTSPNMYRIFAYDDARTLDGFDIESNCLSAPSLNDAFRLGRTYSDWDQWRMLRDTLSVATDGALDATQRLVETSECRALLEVGAYPCE